MACSPWSSANPLITEKYQLRQYKMHRQKLQSVRASIDSQPPRVWRNRPVRNRKKEQLQEERLLTIERENRILLTKMSHIMRHNSLDNRNQRKPKSLNREFRRRELLRITSENKAILQRIQASNPTYDANQWDGAARRHEELARSISKFRPALNCATGTGTPASRGSYDLDGRRPMSSLSARGHLGKLTLDSLRPSTAALPGMPTLGLSASSPGPLGSAPTLSTSPAVGVPVETVATPVVAEPAVALQSMPPE